jgi:putative glutathione S-transferase
VLYVCLACPWAHRSIIVRRLLGLEDAIALRVVDPIRDEKGWRFTLDEGGVDPVTGASYVMELYRRSDPSFQGRATVPFLWDTRAERIVTNDYPQITLDLSTQWGALHGAGALDLYPEHLRQAVDEMSEANFSAIDNGVYKAGFATSQEPYERAYDARCSPGCRALLRHPRQDQPHQGRSEGAGPVRLDRAVRSRLPERLTSRIRAAGSC